MAHMMGLDTVRLGIRNLGLHKLRSLLTVLGIIFGVAAVICMLSITEGRSEDEMAMLRLLGTQNIIVKSVKPQAGLTVSERNERMLTYGIREADLRAIRSTIPHIERVVPLREVAYEATFQDRRSLASVVGTTPEFFGVVKVEVARGRPITPYDMEVGTKVCVIGDDIRRELFRYTDPLGQSLTVVDRATGPVPFRVVGILSRVRTAGTPARGLGQRNINRDIYIPLRTADMRYGTMRVKARSGSREIENVDYSDLYIAVDDQEHVIPVSRMVAQVFRHNHDKQDYEIRVPLEGLRIAQQQKRNRQITLGAIAGVSLLVGGIGIMNIMLATVRERTREIGVRRALGARQRDIAAQFLVETVVLSTVGGILGVALGWSGAEIISRSVGWPTIIHPWTVAVSFGLSVLVGVFFGMYPAVAAARLDPIEALRYE